MSQIVGRKKEQKTLKNMLESPKAEFLAIHGRRRVGKTHLIKNFCDNDSNIFVYITGIKDGTLKDQLTAATMAMGEALLPYIHLQPSKNWMEFFDQLTKLLNNLSKRVVLFFDEVPWLATRKSKFLNALDYYWNRHWSHNKAIKLIVCGSSASWILKNIINNKGGLHNRITRRMNLEPFNLKETKDYLENMGVVLTLNQLLLVYMVMGGIPYYLNYVEKGQSALQIIENIAFSSQGLFYGEFDNLFASLFDAKDDYINIVKVIAKHQYGVSQETIIKEAKISKGGNLIRRLEDLENTHFIMSFLSHDRKRKGKYYRLIDEYTLFYLRWIAPLKETTQKLNKTQGYFKAFSQTPQWKGWTGYAFETVCLRHLAQILKALDIPENAQASSWYNPKAQIDLVFLCPDKTTRLCEIKYREEPIRIDKALLESFNRKKEIYIAGTKTTNQVYFDLIVSTDIIDNEYARDIAKIVTIKDLFQ